MDNAADLVPCGPIFVADRFAGLGEELLALLRGLAPADWERPTVARLWRVRDVAAHLLDTGLRRLSFDRDAWPLPPADRPLASYPDLVAFLDELNATWVTACRRLSPIVLVDLLTRAEAELARYLPTLDPLAPARFGVAWAGENVSPVWFDVARELTERWLHQQQIRLAVGAQSLVAPCWSRPVFETFLRALPPRYAALGERCPAAVSVEIVGSERYAYTVRRAGEGASPLLCHGAAADATARVVLAEEPAWLLFTKGLTGPQARARAEVVGDPSAAAPIFSTLAVMA
jgi:uncharacterized protein (TIGR03083 family)